MFVFFILETYCIVFPGRRNKPPILHQCISLSQFDVTILHKSGSYYGQVTQGARFYEREVHSESQMFEELPQ